MTILPIRANNAYIGIGKQSVQGTAVAPTIFPRWLDGSLLDYALKIERILEGDGTRRAAQDIKNQQYAKVKLICNPRPIEAGFLETAALGISSDTVTGATASTTTSGSSNTAGATSLTLTANTGLTSSGSAVLILEPGTANEEVVTVTTPGTGAGPYVYTITTPSTGLKFTHAASSVARTSTSHAIADKADGNYYTVEVGLGSLGSGVGPTIRITDCKVDMIKRSAKAGTLLTYEIDFCGITSVVQSSASTITLEAHSPFYYDTGVWTLDGATTGDAPYIESFDVTQKNNADIGIQSEKLTLDAIIFGALEVTCGYQAVFAGPSHIYLTLFGSSATPGTGATDAQAIGSGALSLVFTQVDGFHTLLFSITTMHYTSVKLPVPKADGKHFVLPMTAESVSNQGVNTQVLTTTVTNSQTTAY